MTPEEHIAHTMLDLGVEQYEPSTEDDPESVWIDDDEEPGYYARRRIPLQHTLTHCGGVAALEFIRSGVVYRIRVSVGIPEENARRIVTVLETLLDWVNDSIVTWEEAFRPFVHDAWWIVLRVSPDATPGEIDAAYRRRAFACHPDQGGSDEAFRKLREAYVRATSS